MADLPYMHDTRNRRQRASSVVTTGGTMASTFGFSETGEAQKSEALPARFWVGLVLVVGAVVLALYAFFV